MPPSPTRTPRRPLHERSDSETNVMARVRLVPYTPPRLPGDDDDFYSRSPLPTLPSHFLPPTINAFYKDLVGAPDRSGTAVSPHPLPTSGWIVSDSHEVAQADHSPPSTGTSGKSKPFAKKRKQVAINPDNKTFRVLEVDQDDETPTEDQPKSARSNASLVHDAHPFSSRGIASPTTSFASTFSDNAATPSLSRSSPGTSLALTADHTSHSPWNYQFVGGLRKVPKTPDLKQKAPSTGTASSPPLLETPEDSEPRARLVAKASFLSAVTTSSTSSTLNYRVYGSSSTQMYSKLPPPSSTSSHPKSPTYRPSQPRDHHRADGGSPSSSDSNYQILGYSSEDSGKNELAADGDVFDGDIPSFPPYAAISSATDHVYSRESLVVPPLQPKAPRSLDQSGLYRSLSKESLRTGSLTSVSTMLSQEASQALVASASLVQLHASGSFGTATSWMPSAALVPARALMQTHPHQWSSQLSTVPSESDAGTETGSRSWLEVNGQRSIGYRSTPSLQILGVGSSSRFQHDHSRTNSLEPPLRTHPRLSPRLVQGLDEDGDGITDMHDLRLRPSRARLSDFMSVASDLARSSTNRSTTSSRANSLLSSSIPAWARLYYGSGERRYLATPGSSRDGSESRPQSSWRSGSPDTSNFPLNIYSPRKRPRQILSDTMGLSPHQRGSMDISELPESPNNNALIYNHSFRRRFRPSSSVLSPHLRRDKRASRGSRFFLDPASVDWSSDGDVLDRRRRWLILLFITGFIVPFAWMIGALVPLPTLSRPGSGEKGQILGNPEASEALNRVFGPADESRYESLKWWRNLNRGMAVLGVLIVVAIITLLAVGIKQRWTK